MRRLMDLTDEVETELCLQGQEARRPRVQHSRCDDVTPPPDVAIQHRALVIRAILSMRGLITQVQQADEARLRC